jgi:hypothetical protein
MQIGGGGGKGGGEGEGSDGEKMSSIKGIRKLCALPQSASGRCSEC